MTDPDLSPNSADVLGRRLRAAGRTLATAETVTTGGIGTALAAVPDSGEWLRGSIVAYASAVTHALLDVVPGPVVNREAAIAMAFAATRVMNSDVAIATTGWSGPESFEGQPPGTVWVAVVIGDAASAREFHFTGDPEDIRRQSIVAALGYASSHVDETLPAPSADALESRAHLLPEEEAAGSADPVKQAAAILEESSARVLASDDADDEQSEGLERRTSADTVEPVDSLERG